MHLTRTFRPITHLLREAGYYTVNLHPPKPRPQEGAAGNGKRDFNFSADSMFDGSDWNTRKPGQPFFAQMTIVESHRGEGWNTARKQKYLVNPRAVRLPSYIPDRPAFCDDLANYLDAVNLVDTYVGEVLARLEREGLAKNTVVMLIGDNGNPLIRNKEYLYDGGLHVPLIVRWPDVLPAGRVDDRLVSGIDLPATTLRIAGVSLPATMQGRPFFGRDAVSRDHVIGARDRTDNASDRIRSVRTARWNYIRNYFPMIPYMQLNPYMERAVPAWNELVTLAARGALTPAQRLFTGGRKPIEELYDLAADPDEVHNLAGRPAQDSVLKGMRKVLDTWIVETGDQGDRIEEPLDVFHAHFNTFVPDSVSADRRDAARRVYFGVPADTGKVVRRPRSSAAEPDPM